MGKIIIPIILVDIEITIIQTIIFEYENMFNTFSKSLPKKTLQLRNVKSGLKNYTKGSKENVPI